MNTWGGVFLCAATSQVPGELWALPSLGSRSPQPGSRGDFPPATNFPHEIIEDFAFGSDICPGGLMLLFFIWQDWSADSPAVHFNPLKDVFSFLSFIFLTSFLLFYWLCTDDYLRRVLAVYACCFVRRVMVMIFSFACRALWSNMLCLKLLDKMEWSGFDQTAKTKQYWKNNKHFFDELRVGKTNPFNSQIICPQRWM